MTAPANVEHGLRATQDLDPWATALRTPPAHALARLLSLRGREANRQALAEALGARPAPERVAAALEEHAVPARVVRIGGHALSKLTFPTMLFWSSGGAAVMTEARGGGVVIETSAGRTRTVSPAELAAGWSGLALDLAVAPPAQGSLARRMGAVLRGQSRSIATFLAITALSHLLGLASPAITRHVMDAALPDGGGRLLEVLAAAVLFLALHRAWLGWLRQRAIVAVDAGIEAAMLRGVLGQLLGARFPFFQGRTVGELLQIMGSTETLCQLVSGAVLVPVVEAMLAVSYVVLIAASLPWLAVGMGLLGALLAALTAWGAHRHATLQDAELSASSRQRALLFELLEATPTIKAAAIESLAAGRWLGRLVDQQVILVRRMRLGLSLDLLFEGSTQVVFVAILVSGSARCLRGELSVGTLIANVLLAQSFMSSMLGLSHAALPIWGSRGDLRRVREALAAPAEPRQPSPIASRRAREPVGVVLDDVWFRYTPDGPWIVKGVTLRVAPRGVHRLTGASGTGKTTLLRLVAGLLEPERGMISVGDADAARARAEVAYLPQSTHLFEGSILDNLRVLSGASTERIVEAATLTGLDRIVSAMPMGYQTMLPPGGGTLSGGQRQLVVLTACVASERKVVLLDEALANLDRLSRERLSLGKLFEGRTVIYVEHDPIDEARNEP